MHPRDLPLFALVVTAFAIDAPAQGLLTYTARVGQNIAYCGPPGSGPLVQHTFLTPAATSDSITVSDPGTTNLPPSTAHSQVDAIPTTSGLMIGISGSATRGGPGVSATGDARENWKFTLSAPARFTISASATAASTESIVGGASSALVPIGGGASFIPDPGSAPPPYSVALSVPGSASVAGTGTLTPGTYAVSVQGRTECNNSTTGAPFSGSFQCALLLDLRPAATVATRTASGNPNSYVAGAPVLGKVWHGTVAVSTTGHQLAVLFGGTTTAQLPLVGGQTLLLGGSVFQLTPAVSGPQANLSLALPPAAALAGLVVPTQAVHVGGAPGFALSNAQDWTLGF